MHLWPQWPAQNPVLLCETLQSVLCQEAHSWGIPHPSMQMSLAGTLRLSAFLGSILQGILGWSWSPHVPWECGDRLAFVCAEPFASRIP